MAMLKEKNSFTSKFDISGSEFCGSAKRILLIGYGNPGRLDDGLGPALAEKFQTLESVDAVSSPRFQPLENLTVESNYQLNVEDAAQIAEHDIVIFADASTDAEPPFTFTPVEAEAGGPSFSSHSISAPQLLGMTEELFGKKPEGWMLAIRGVEFNEFGERLSAQAEENLEAAAAFLTDRLEQFTFEMSS
jgi:hydrogenase maturation protease